MKVVILCLALVAVVMCEQCKQLSDCTVTQCSEKDEKIHCIDNVCTCFRDHTSGSTCTLASDCPDCDRHERKHCIDSRCRCTRF